ncbi:divalent cation tolerance 1 family protein [Cystoisospora suis]|uniref:Divalent cation tolerance 1 family protein n=1 Tax=Cystoisospora suis TaxID=483139 RepID=A0A2C6KV22_9APIC|nr:divalent cation tolerance 1 family protein [Cystoisospora suis]
MKGKISTTLRKARLVSSPSLSFSRFNPSYLKESFFFNFPSSRCHSPLFELGFSFFFLSPMTLPRPSSSKSSPRFQHLSHHLPSLHFSRVQISSSVLFCTYLLCTYIHSSSSVILTSLDPSSSSPPPPLGFATPPSSSLSDSSSSFPSISFEAFAFSPSTSSLEKTSKDSPSSLEKQKEEKLSRSDLESPKGEEDLPGNSSLGTLSGESEERKIREVMMLSNEEKGRNMSNEDRTSSLTSQLREEEKKEKEEEKDERKNRGEFRMAYVTCKDKQQGSEIAEKLVTARLAACVNIVPGITSIYEWEGQIEKDEEVLLIIKTKRELEGEVIKAVRQLHSYDVPEVIFVDIVGGNDAYLDWVRKNTRS